MGFSFSLLSENISCVLLLLSFLTLSSLSFWFSSFFSSGLFWLFSLTFTGGIPIDITSEKNTLLFSSLLSFFSSFFSSLFSSFFSSFFSSGLFWFTFTGGIPIEITSEKNWLSSLGFSFSSSLSFSFSFLLLSLTNKLDLLFLTSKSLLEEAPGKTGFDLIFFSFWFWADDSLFVFIISNPGNNDDL